MRKELKQISENALGFRDIAELSVYGSASKTAIGKTAAYIIGELMKTSDSFEYAYNSDSGLEVYGGSVRNVSEKAEYMRGFEKTAYYGDEGRYTPIDSILYSSGNDKYVKTLERYLGENVNQAVSIAAIVGADVFKMSKAAVPGAVDNMTVTGISETAAEKISGYYFLENHGIENFDKGRVSDYLAWGESAKNTVYKTKEVFDPTDGYGQRKGRLSAIYPRDTNAVDIVYIGEAIARQLHEEIAAGFPMYVRCWHDFSGGNKRSYSRILEIG